MISSFWALVAPGDEEILAAWFYPDDAFCVFREAIGMLVVILTMATFVLDIIKGVKAIASGMHTIVDGGIWCLLLPGMYNRPKVGCADGADSVSLDSILMEYDGAACCVIDVRCVKQWKFVSIRGRDIDNKNTIVLIAVLMSQFCGAHHLSLGTI